jgi:hypothetical protein
MWSHLTLLGDDNLSRGAYHQAWYPRRGLASAGHRSQERRLGENHEEDSHGDHPVRALGGHSHRSAGQSRKRAGVLRHRVEITWLANANLAGTNTFGVTGINGDFADVPGGWMTWQKANEWIGAVNTANYLGANQWRMPNAIDTGLPGCTSFANGGTDCGYNTDPSAGELAHLFFVTLGNSSAVATDGTPTGCGGSSAAPDYCFTNTGPFQNLPPSLYAYYWYGTTYAPEPVNAWTFFFGAGYQAGDDKTDSCCYYVWAVHDGDPLNAVPIPAAVWLFGGALGALGVVRRRAKSAA